MSSEPLYHVAGVGNAIVDIYATCDETFLLSHGLTKGVMTLVDLEQSNKLSHVLDIIKQQSGGSGANTIAGIAAMGGRCAFIGKVNNDEAGRIFRKDMHDLNVAFKTKEADDPNLPTARCISFVTPDADRTMVTYLGVSTEIAPDDLDIEKIRNARVTYLEGYLFDKEMAKEAFHAAAIMAHTAGRLVALSLSDPFCVIRHRDDFRKLVQGHIDILFCNKEELLALYESTDLDDAMRKIGENVEICAVTRGAEGATVITKGTQIHVPAIAIEKVVDTTGAGDLFAAGFLYGYTHDKSPEECGMLGVKAAAEVIAQVGARPIGDLKKLLSA